MHADGRPSTGHGHQSLLITLLLAVVLLAPASTSAATFRQIVERPVSPVFGLHDSALHTMDTLKVIDSGQAAPRYRYIGVYHYRLGLTYVTAVATSNDLVRWAFRANLGVAASQPAIGRVGTGTSARYWVASEADCPRGSCIKLRYYASYSALMVAQASLQHMIPHTQPGKCNEGTPNFFSPPTATSLDIGFHYNSTCRTGTDREARGTLTGLGTTWTWSAATDQPIDNLLTNAGAPGNHGDRDRIVYQDHAYRIYEAQLQPAVFESFRPFLYDGATMSRLSVQTGCGATALANTSVSSVTLPSGAPGVFVAHFIFAGGAGTCRAGEMTYFAPVS
jgi:hypothetical protein